MAYAASALLSHAMTDSTVLIARSPWVSSEQAAEGLSLSRASLYRRIRQPHWVEGRHYRWISKGARKVLQFHCEAVGDLIRRRGW